MDFPTTPTSHFPYAASLLLLFGFILAASIGSVAWFAATRPVGWKGKGAPKSSDAPGNELETDGYDRFMIPTETAQRQAREGQSFRTLPTSEASLDTTNGFTVDREGLANNYAVEPEIYAEIPGDMKHRNRAIQAEKAAERREIRQTDEAGELTMAGDTRGKGVGVV